MEKAHLSTTEDKVVLTIPFAKNSIDLEKRIVSGFGTLNNIDHTDDVITKEASIEAWSTWRGNVREQHSDLAAGRIIGYFPEEYIDEYGNVYDGLYVNVYVSKGAPTTWEKVLDGTLSGFSVGGNILECHTEYLPDDNRTVRYITKYRMVELSLVDSPGNELCNVLSIQKNDDGSTKLQGMATEILMQSVFWCPNDRIAVAAREDVRKCSACQNQMDNIGWFEPEEGVPESNSIRKILQAKNKLEKNLDETKGGSEMSDEAKKEEVNTEVQEVKEPNAKASENEALVEVVQVDEPDLATITKALNEIQAALSENSAKTREETVEEIQKAVASVKEDVDAKLDGLLKKHDKLEEEVKGFKENLGNVEKNLSTVLGAVETIEKTSAVKKSSDTEDLEKADQQKGLWSGSLLPSYDR